MATIINTIRWASNSAELASNLKQGLDTIDATRAAADKMVQTLSGDRLIAAANKYTAAVIQMGGAAGIMAGAEQLSAGEKERINSLLDKAIEKYDLLGRTAPTAMTELAAATKGASDSTGGWIGILNELGGSFVARVAEGVLLRDMVHEVLDVIGEVVGALPELVKHSIEVGNSLFEMSVKTGASVEGLSALRYVASQTGIDFSSFGTTLSMMEKNLGATGAAGDNVKKTLSSMGLDLATIKGMRSDEAFITIAQSLEAVQNNADKAHDAALLMGRGAKEMAALWHEDIGEMIQEAHDLGLVMSTDTAAGAHLAEIGFQTLHMQVEALGMQLANAFIPAIVGVESDLRQGLTVAVKTLNDELGQTGGSGGFLATVATAMGKGGDATKAQIALYEDLKAALIGVVRGGLEPLVTGVGFTMSELDAAKVVFGDTMQVIQGFSLALLYADKALIDVGLHTKSAAEMPAMRAAWQANDDAIQQTLVSMKKRGEALQADKKAETDWSQWSVDANKAIEASMTALAAAHTDVGKKITEMGDVSRHAYNDTGEVVDNTKTKVSAFQKAVEDVESAGDDWRATLDTIDGAVVQNGEALLKAGVSASTLAKYYGLTSVQVKALESDIKSQSATLAANAKVATETAGLWADYYKQTAAASGDSVEAQIAGVNKWYAAKYAELEKSKASDEEISDAELALANDYYAKLNDVRSKDAERQQKYLNEGADLWNSYYAYVDKTGTALAAQQQAADMKWYNDKRAAFDLTKAANQNYDDDIAALDAALWVKLQTRADAAQQKRAQLLQQDADNWAQVTAIEATLTGDALQSKLDANEKWYEDTVAKNALVHKDDVDYWNGLQALVQAKRQQIIASYDPLQKSFELVNTDMRNTWAGTWEQAINNTTSFGTAFTTTLQAAVEDPFKKMLAGLLADLEQMFLGPALAETRNVMAQLFGMTPTSTGFAGASGAATPTAAGSSAMAAIFHRLGNSQTGPVAGPGGGVWDANGNFIGSSTVTSAMEYGTSPSVGQTGMASFDEFGAQTNTGMELPSTGEVGYLSMPEGGSGFDASASPATSGGGASAGSIAGGGLMALGGVVGLLNAQTTGAAMLAGTQAGAGIGTMIMPGIGTAIGAGVGFLVGALKGVFGNHEVSDIARMAGSDFGGAFSQATSDAIKKDVDAGMTEQGAMFNHLSEIITDLGGITSKNLDMMTSKFHDLFSMQATGEMTMAQVNAQLTSSFPALATAATDAYGRVTDGLKQIVALNTTFGNQNTAIAAWESTQASNIVTGVNATVAAAISPADQTTLDALGTARASAETGITGDISQLSTDDYAALVSRLNDAYKAGFQGDINKFYAQEQTAAGSTAPTVVAYNTAVANQATQAPVNQSSLTNLTSSVVGAYETDVAAGKSPADALKDVGPALTALQKDYKDLGLTISDTALNELVLQNTINTGNPTLMAGIAGLSQAMVGFDNLGLETKSMFADQEAQGENMYAQLSAAAVAAGGTQADALKDMQTYLHNAVIEAGKLGVPVDAATQSMIDASKQAGIWQDDVTPSDPMLAAMKTLNDTITDVDRALRGLPPITTVTVHYNADGSIAPPDAPAPPGGWPTTTPTSSNSAQPQGGDGGFTPPAAATGGIVTALGLQRFVTGGVVQRTVYAPPSSSPDTELVWTTPGEVIMNEAQSGRVANLIQSSAAMAQDVRTIAGLTPGAVTAPTGPAVGGGDLNITLTMDGKVITAAVIKNFRFNKKVGKGGTGAYTQARGALGLTS